MPLVLDSIDGEKRSTYQSQTINLATATASHFAQVFGPDSVSLGFAEEAVTEQTALAVPAIWAAISGIAGDVSALPLHVYRQTPGGREPADTDPVAQILESSTVNDDGLTTVQLLRWIASRMQIDGRAVVYIERNKAGRVANLIPFYDLSALTVQRIDNKRLYTYRFQNSSTKTYQSSEVLDFVLHQASDGLSAISPIVQHRNSISVIIALSRYCATIFNGGGVPITIATMPPAAPNVMDQATDDISASIRKVRQERRPVMAVPNGVEFKTLGQNSSDLQMIELRAFLIREVCRIWNVPPIYLRDMDGATFTNSEQQELFYTTHTLLPLVALIEAEINTKLFGRKNTNFVEFDMTRILRGDLLSQAEAYGSLVMNGIMKPSEVRELLNLRPDKDADKLLVQGAMVGLGAVETEPSPDPAPAGPKADPATEVAPQTSPKPAPVKRKPK